MSKSKFLLDQISGLIEKGLINYKDISNEIINILKSKRDEIIFKMKITSKEESEILAKRIEKLEIKVSKLEKIKTKKTKKVKKS